MFIRLTEGRFLLLNRVIHFMLPQIQPLAPTYSFIYVIQRTLARHRKNESREQHTKKSRPLARFYQASPAELVHSSEMAFHWTRTCWGILHRPGSKAEVIWDGCMSFIPPSWTPSNASANPLSRLFSNALVCFSSEHISLGHHHLFMVSQGPSTPQTRCFKILEATPTSPTPCPSWRLQWVWGHFLSLLNNVSCQSSWILFLCCCAAC